MAENSRAKWYMLVGGIIASLILLLTYVGINDFSLKEFVPVRAAAPYSAAARSYLYNTSGEPRPEPQEQTIPSRIKQWTETIIKGEPKSGSASPNYTIRYTPPSASGIRGSGKPFRVDPPLLDRLEIPVHHFSTLTADSVQDVVFITGISSNHFGEAKDAIASVQHNMPGCHVYVYDLGLKQKEVDEINRICNSSVVKFDFEKYPPHVKTLHNYAFKPLCIQDALRTHDNIFWMDASVRLKKGFNEIYPQILATKGYLQFFASPHNNFDVTHPGMYEYILTDKEKQKRTNTFAAGADYLSKTSEVYDGILKWWLMCALDPDCIAPKGARLGCKKNFKHGVWCGCHRYDMSVLNTLTANYFGYNITRYTSSDSNVLEILRRRTNKYDLHMCS